MIPVHPTNDVWYETPTHWGGYDGSALLIWPTAAEGPQNVPVGQATEAETANPIAPRINRAIPIGRASEVELARLISPVKPIFVPVQTAVERELARIITAQKGEPFLPVVECAITSLPVACQVATLPVESAILTLGVSCEIVDGYGQNH